MADAGGRSTLSAILVFAILIGLGLWVLMVLSTEGEQRLDQACRPVQVGTQFLHDTASAVAGRQTQWTLYVQRYLMTGCYYGFSILFTNTLEHNDLSGVPATLGTGQASGGLQQ